MLKLLTLIAATIGSSAMPIMDEEPRLLMPREPAAHFESLAVINDEIQPFSYSANDGKWMVSLVRKISNLTLRSILSRHRAASQCAALRRRSGFYF